jgi:hypothetical protein
MPVRTATPDRWFLLLGVALIALPLVGVVLSGQPIAPYLEFPPLTRYVKHASFSWPVFLGLSLLIIAIMAPCVWRWLIAAPSSRERVPQKRRFPGWGWLGVGLIAAGWTLAWTRFSWFAAFQPFTFTPLWLGYIIVMNALTCRATGACLLVERRRSMLLLFFASATFWWFFEYLNRFVQNWYYAGIDDFGPWAYAFHATLAFSTVLPAVASTVEWLATLPRLRSAFGQWTPISLRHPGWIGWVVLALAGGGLMGIGIWPDVLFPLLWVSPLLLITSVQAIQGRKTIFSGLRRGDWTPICLPALAGLQCGFFWELWNWHSLAHWEYTIPYVHRFLIFEMPLLGYAGYLPFGLECLVLAHLIQKR